jgi:hypothetical protein
VRVLLRQMGSKDPVVQAKAWTALASSSALPSDQFEALRTAIEVLEGTFAQAGARVELAEWMYLNRFPTEVWGCASLVLG